MKIKNVYNIDLNLTDVCNFKCSYCFEGCGTQHKRQKTIQNNIVKEFKNFIYTLKKSDFFINKYNSIMIAFWRWWANTSIRKNKRYI